MLWGDALEWSDEVISAIVNQPLQFYEQPDEDNFDLRVPCPSPIAQTFPDDGLQIHPALFLPEWDVSFSNLSEEMPDCSILSEWEDSSEALKGVGSFDDSIF